MRKKINTRFIILICAAVILTVTFSTLVFYSFFKNETSESLLTYARVLADSGEFDDPENIYYSAGDDEIRVTLISSEGDVIYDSVRDPEELGNHGDRPEVIEAFENGQATSVRHSDTLGQNTFYAAVLLDNGCVLRAAMEADGIISLFATVLPAIIIITCILLVIVFIITHFLTKSIVRPIEEMSNNMDNISKVHAYREMQPFIDVIYRQHEEVLKTADMRQAFTANVSHELKTPLTAISGYSELIESGMTNDKETKRFAKEIHRSSNRLLSLINDIIRLSELDVIDNETDFETLDLFEAAKSAVGMMQVSAKKHDVSLSLDGESAFIDADRMMIEEVIYNLTDNAIRYNKPGGAVVVDVRGADDGVILSVRDTGIGISKKDSEHIFERFYRVDKSRSKQTGGTGLGLAIVKHIVKRHNAKIRMESEEGKGTTIEVVFPRADGNP